MKRLKKFIFQFAMLPKKNFYFKKIDIDHGVGHIFHRMRKLLSVE
jgi:hypothetical protein